MAIGKKTGGGSRKGKPNKTTADIKEMVLTALSDAGGSDYLLSQAKENPSAFLSLLGKVIPKDVNVGGQPENPVQIQMRPKLSKEEWITAFGGDS